MQDPYGMHDVFKLDLRQQKAPKHPHRTICIVGRCNPVHHKYTTTPPSEWLTQEPVCHTKGLNQPQRAIAYAF